MTTIPTITNEQEYIELTSTVTNMILEHGRGNLNGEQISLMKKLAEEVIRYRTENNLEQ